MAQGVVVMFHGNTGSRRFDNVEGRTVTTEHFYRRPFRQNRNRRRRVRGKLLRRVNDLSADDSENGFDALDAFLWNGKIIVAQRNEICQLAGSNRSLVTAFVRKPTAALGVKPQRFLAIEAVLI